MEKTRVLFISQEITPFLPETRMSLVGRHLPQGIQELGKEIRTFMPRFGCINERRNQLHEVIRLSGMNLIIDDTDHPLILKVSSIQAARMQVYFIDSEDFFQRKFIVKDSKGTEFEDNDERSMFFVKGVLETVKKLQWAPNLIHCHGWFSALAPLYVKKIYNENPLFTNAKVVYSLYDNEFKKPLNSKILKKILLEGVEQRDIKELEKPNFLALTKLAIKYSDAIIQGEEKIDKEIIEIIKQSKKPFLPHQSKDKYIETYSRFYDKMLRE